MRCCVLSMSVKIVIGLVHNHGDKYSFFFNLFFYWRIIVAAYCCIEFCCFLSNLFSVKPQHESAIGIHISPPFWTSLLSASQSHPSRLIQSPCLSFLRPRETAEVHAWRNYSRKKEGMEPKQKQYPTVDVTGDRSKVRCCKEQYY